MNTDIKKFVPLLWLFIYFLFLSIPSVGLSAPVSSSQITPANLDSIAKVIAFTTINNGDTFISGQTITIGLTTTDGSTLSSVSVIVPEIGMFTIEEEPYTTDILIPKAALGSATFSVVGKDTNGRAITSDDVTINIRTTASFAGYKVYPESVFLSDKQSSRQLRVVGNYSDGFQRDITDTTFGTSYTLVDPLIASVDSGGKITPLIDGRTELIVRNGSFEKTVIVEVSGVYGPPEFDFIHTTKLMHVSQSIVFNVSAKTPQGTIPVLTTDLIPSGANFVDNGDGTGTFSWIPTEEDEGVGIVQFVATDSVDTILWDSLGIEIIVKPSK